MSNRITVSDEQHTALKRYAKQRFAGDLNEAAADVLKTGLARKKALSQYADKVAAEKGKERKPRSKKTKGEKKKKRKEQAAAEKPATAKKKKKKKAAKEAVEQSTEEVAID